MGLQTTPMALQPTVSSVAGPVAAPVHVGSVRSNPSTHSRTRSNRGRPADAEMEETDEDDDNASNSVGSFAQDQLKAIKAIFGNEHGGARPQGVAPTRPEGWSSRGPPALTESSAAPPSPVRPSADPVQVPPAFPYNLPIAALPMSPRATRQQMLRTELSDSVRSNLIWQRKIDKQQVQPPRRNKSTTSVSTIPSVVKITEKKSKGDTESNDRRTEEEREEARDQIRRVNLQRNKSWGADYHPR